MFWEGGGGLGVGKGLFVLGTVGVYFNFGQKSVTLFFFFGTSFVAEDCTEPVLWIVYQKTIAISEAQLSVYRQYLSNVEDKNNVSLCSHNFRPLHPLNPPVTASSRKLYWSYHHVIDRIAGQATSTRTLFFRQYNNFVAEFIPPLLGTGATIGACEY